jgi:hypothetical protein
MPPNAQTQHLTISREKVRARSLFFYWTSCELGISLTELVDILASAYVELYKPLREERQLLGRTIINYV